MNVYLVVLRYDYEGDEVVGAFTSMKIAKDFISNMWVEYRDKAVILKPDLNPDINNTRYKP